MKIEELMKEVYTSPASYDFKNALLLHSQSRDYDPYFEDKPLREELSKELESKNYPKVIEAAYNILKKKPFDIESHVMVSQAAFKLDKKELFHFHNFIASSLVDRIIRSGDGKNYHTAYKIYYPEDEIAVFTFLRKYPKERVNQEKYSRAYDVYSFEDGTQMFFDITIPFTHISGEKEKEN